MGPETARRIAGPFPYQAVIRVMSIESDGLRIKLRSLILKEDLE